MSWLDDRDITYRYVCADNHESRYTYKSSEAPDNHRDPIACPTEGCAHNADYAGFLHDDVNLTTKVTFDQNGRKGIRTSDGKGNVHYMSATKAKYLETGIVDHQYTNDYKEKLEKDKELNAHLLQTDFNRRMARVTAYTDKPKPGRKAAP